MLKWLDIDRVLLYLAQRISDEVQRYSGIMKFRLEKWMSILGSLFFTCAGILITVWRPELLFITVPFVLLAVSLTARVIWRTEREEAEFLKTGRLSVSPWHASWGRYIFLAFSFGYVPFDPTDLAPYLLMYGYVATVISVYFSVCIPQPPGKSKFKEWYEKALARLNDMLQPSPEPAPNS